MERQGKNLIKTHIPTMAFFAFEQNSLCVYLAAFLARSASTADLYFAVWNPYLRVFLFSRCSILCDSSKKT